jgi:hypothetical protein
MVQLLAMMTVLVSVQPVNDGAAVFRQRYREVILEGQPKDGDEAYALLAKAADRLKALTHDVVAKSFPGEKADETDFQALTRDGATERQKEITRSVVKELSAGEMPRLTAALAKATRLDRTMTDALLLEQKLPGLGHARQIARYQSGRMTVALDAGDTDAWFTAFEETLVLGQQVSREPTMISAMVGVAVQAVAMESAQRFVASPHANEATLSRLMRVILAHPAPGPGRAIRGERILAEDSIDYVYAAGEAGIDRLGGNADAGGAPPRPAKRLVPDGQAIGPGMPAREEHVRILMKAYDAVERLADLPASDRATSEHRKVLDRVPEESLLARMLLPAFDRAFLSFDLLECDRTGVLVLAALERRRLARGTYPETLAELGPELQGVQPTDGYSGKPLGYLPPSRGPYEGGRAFVLYAAGADGIDDGGKVNFANPHDVNKKDARGGDLLLNRVVK